LDDTTEVIRTLFERHADDVYRYAKYALPPEMDAKDVVQEVFLRAFRYWSDFKGNADPKTWLLRIARNHIYDLLRKKRRQRIYETEALNKPHAASLDTIIELEDALHRMSPSHRQVLSLRWIQGLSVSETSSVLGWSESCSEGSIRTIHGYCKSHTLSLRPVLMLRCH
jgi:RNA polymerase sigma-70 factor, ECF subfamily